jgi:aspartate oxidase
MSEILTGDAGVGPASPARLTFDLDVDICVVGAGLAGLTVALEAARASPCWKAVMSAGQHPAACSAR